MPARRGILLVAVLHAFLACGGEDEVPIPDTCNGSTALCARTYDQVAYATTHNAMSNGDEGWVNPNQHRDMTTQLSDGVRAMMLDVHPWEDDVYLCHGLCQLGNKPLVDGLDEIASFLQANRGEVVTILFESYVTPADIETAFADAGLLDMTYAHAVGQPWPTLRELIDTDQRVVVLSQDGGGAFPWFMDVWAHAWDTDYAARMVSDFSCDPSRGTAGNPLFILNHFLTRSLPVPDEAEDTNGAPYLLDRATECMNANSQLPNFIAVDFYSVGSVLDVVDSLNGL